VLQYISEDKQKKFNRKFIKISAIILFEKKSRIKDYYWGRSEFYQNIIVKSYIDVISMIKRIKVIKISKNRLCGRIF
jgi:tRNA A37 methylthiotransferase MiaB